jgi:hypothetical protein
VAILLFIVDLVHRWRRSMAEYETALQRPAKTGRKPAWVRMRATVSR